MVRVEADAPFEVRGQEQVVGPKPDVDQDDHGNLMVNCSRRLLWYAIHLRTLSAVTSP